MRRLLVLLVTVVAAGVLAPVADAGAPAGRAGDPGYHQPAVGACYRLIGKEPDRPSAVKQPISCEREHTMMTIAVVRLSPPIDWDDVFRRVSVRCHEALYDALGTRRYAGLSAYDLWWFRPTEEERAAGARWVRCDVGMHLDSTGIQPIPATVHLGRPPYENRQSNCLAGAYPDLRYTTCQRPHSYRAAKVVRIFRLARSEEQYQRQGARCRAKVRTRDYIFQGPSRDAFRAGNHFMVCYRPDRLGEPRAGSVRR